METVKFSETLFVVITKEYITSMNAIGNTVFCRNDRWYLSNGETITRLKEKKVKEQPLKQKTPKKISKQSPFAELHPELYLNFDKKAAFDFLADKYGRRCLRCSATKRLIVDHIVPRRRGGTNDYSNLQILCFPCNFRKGLLIIDFR